ncbi:WD40 repeat-like protein [Clathrospora elynae]|uniref:WD40 repeat-like protein n=1 Tax=Clathrospora elynae TaxID=706981 RepID=A0A6A5SP48_9PLEO|nr:WD40 repeat-like protein [Clathrospora elynae]
MSPNLSCDALSQMSPTLHHECTRVPVTALASCGPLLIAAEGPFLRFYHAKDSQYISSQRVFKAQAVHGISVCSEDYDHVAKLVVWGGRLVRALEIDLAAQELEQAVLNISSSDVTRASDWILDLALRPTSLDDASQHQKNTCVAVTAHNALLQVTIKPRGADGTLQNNLATVSISELTSSSRSILYSAHLFWDSLHRVLVAAGTAFGEIIYWSWSDERYDEPLCRIHRVFLGHEGSIFGVQISKELPSDCCQRLRRVIASCSDDRTIRIWDVSDVNITAIASEAQDANSEVLRTRHTGFSNEAFDLNDSSSSDCLAIGWGHLSRIWTVRFLEASPCSGSLLLQSAGEDATARTWELTPNTGNSDVLSYKLLQLDSVANHSGKNMWSTVVFHTSAGLHKVVCGAADSKITAAPLICVAKAENVTGETTTEYTVHDVLSWAQPAVPKSDAVVHENHRSSKKAEFFRSYCFIDESTFLVTTNSGKVLLGTLSSDANLNRSNSLSGSTFVTQLEDLAGYSVCTSGSLPGIAFIAGAKGDIYIYRKNTATLERVHSVSGKVADMLTIGVPSSSGRETVALLVALVGQKEAQLLYVDVAHEPKVFCVVHVSISESLTGSLITSMAYVRASGTNFLLIGFRRGSIAVYSIREDEPGTGQATLFKVIDKVHDDETVTSLAWVALSTDSSLGHLISVGRDGRLAVYYTDLSANYVQLVHKLSLPFGPNIEGLYFQDNRLLVYGFSSKKWCLYDVTDEEEVMGIETGGAHRSWTFQAHSASLGGTLVWTRASSMHIYSQRGPSHTVIRSGGHGREIKAVAVSPKGISRSCSRLIATGAEDTDIKIFHYVDGHLACRRTLRKHTTGIQHLQWSEDGSFLFSSGGCEEFYIWRILNLPSILDVGVVCEHMYAPESEHSDLRIMAFDVTTHGSTHIIAMVFSDSSIKVNRYDPTAAVKWQPLAKGLYFTSCLTQCTFLSPLRILTAGTDGHAVVWDLSPEINGPIGGGPPTSAAALTWQHPARIHQNSSKVMVSHILNDKLTLIVSGGDDGSLAFLLAQSAPSASLSSATTSYASVPILLIRAHASAVTACATLTHRSRIFMLTSGNDEWVRLWEITLQGTDSGTENKKMTGLGDGLKIQRLKKIKTNVADVSSMAVLDAGDGIADVKVLVCGVGMEVIRIEW